MKTQAKTTLLLLSLLILITLLGSGLIVGVTAQTPEPSPYPLCEEIGPYPTNLAGWLTIAYQCVYMPLMQNSMAP